MALLGVELDAEDVVSLHRTGKAVAVHGSRQDVRFALEEDAALMPDGKWDWIDGRQTSFYLIQP